MAKPKKNSAISDDRDLTTLENAAVHRQAESRGCMNLTTIARGHCSRAVAHDMALFESGRLRCVATLLAPQKPVSNREADPPAV